MAVTTISSSSRVRTSSAAAALWASVISAPVSAQTLFDFEGAFDAGQVTTDDASVALRSDESGQGLEVTLGTTNEWPTVTLPAGAWDLSSYLGLSLDVTNLGEQGLGLHARIGGAGWQHNRSFVWVDPGETQTLFIVFYRAAPPDYIGSYLTGMRGLPGGYLNHWETPDLTQLTTVALFAAGAQTPAHFKVDNVRATGSYDLPTEPELSSGFFPLLDEFGQYRHWEWPGKLKALAEIAQQHQAELADLEQHPGPEQWNQYGGWSGGPELEATGHFRAQLVDGKWWLVDPEGRLFWSQGIDCVGHWQSGPTEGREHYFTEIPENGDFRAANLRRKFGEDWNTWSTAAADLAHRRLRSWGQNTIGNWSDGSIYEQARTPYVVSLSSGIAKDVPEALDEASFRTAVQGEITADVVAASQGDPMCIGYFVDNELNWPASNAAVVAETYYKVVAERLQALAPNKLYLGSRIHTGSEEALRAAANHCDVVSINRYAYTVSDFALPDGVDKPVIIGEFHFGALDRGLPHTGLRSVSDQHQRAHAYTYYLQQALAHPNVVGAHWFQWSDQIFTGRFDGENYQIGFLDIVDKPYPEMVGAARSLGSYLYDFRATGYLPPPVVEPPAGGAAGTGGSGGGALVPGGGAASPGGGTAGTSAGGGSTGSAAATPATSAQRAGCGCRTAAAPGGAQALGLLLLLALGGLRRRR